MKFEVGDLVTIREPKRGEGKSCYEVAQIEERLSVEGWYFVYYLKARGENGFDLPYAYEEEELNPSALEETKGGELLTCHVYELRLKLHSGENSTVIHRAVTAEELFVFWDKVKDYFSTILRRDFGELETWVPVYVELEMARRNFEGICFYQLRAKTIKQFIEEMSIAFEGDARWIYPIKLPCKLATPVWIVKNDGVEKGEVVRFYVSTNGASVYINCEGSGKVEVYDISWFGETIFLNEVEAIKAADCLKEGYDD